MEEAIRDVKARHEQYLLSLPGVVSVGIGRGTDGREEIVVGLDGPRPQTVNHIPPDLEGHRVRTRITGPLHSR
jgi:hypothetical protein